MREKTQDVMYSAVLAYSWLLSITCICVHTMWSVDVHVYIQCGQWMYMSNVHVG